MAAQLGEPPDEASKRAIDGNLPVSVSGDGGPVQVTVGRSSPSSP
jgi:hypothetical protein